MEDQMSVADISSNNLVVREVEDDEVEEEFRSCCGEDNIELKERDESFKQDLCDESTVKMYFKGISIDGFGESGSGFTGIGVVIEGSSSFPVTCVQKRLEFFVEAPVANYLALIDGLLEVLKTTVRSVFAFSDSKILCQQMMFEVSFDMPLMVALRERVHELVGQLDAFRLKLVPSAEAERPLQLARVAIGLVALHAQGHDSLEICTICCDDKPPLMMLTLRCSHKFCSQCLKTYAIGKVEAGQVPVRCPHTRCNYILSTCECKMFLPVISYDILEKTVEELNVPVSENFYCPYQNCLALLDPYECLQGEASFLYESSNDSIQCPVCQRSICMNCGDPHHNSLSCGEYQDLPLDERDSADLSLHCLAQHRRWRRCQLCRRMIELEQGCYHMTCWCGHEFCYLCGAEYRDRQQTCQCAFWDESCSVDAVTPEADHWAWNSFDTNPTILDAYSDQERSQLAIIQRFLAGGFNLSDDHSCQLPPPCTDSYIDSMKDLHQLPWLERFVSVISDNYYEDYIH